MRINRRRSIAAVAALSLVAAACGDDDDDRSTDRPPAGAAATDGSRAATDAPAADGRTGRDRSAVRPTHRRRQRRGRRPRPRHQRRRQGRVRHRRRRARATTARYYQALVDGAIAAVGRRTASRSRSSSTTSKPPTRRPQLGDLAQQNVDMIIVGAGEIAEPLPDLIEQYPDIFWYCNCGAGFPENPGLAQSQRRRRRDRYTAGYATGLLLQDNGRRQRRRSSAAATSASRSSRTSPSSSASRPSTRRYTMTYVADGRLPVRLRQHRQRHRGAQRPPSTRAPTPSTRTSAAPTSRSSGWPTRTAIITMSAGVVEGLRAATDLDYDIAVKFDGGDYVGTIFAEIIDGTLQRGRHRVVPRRRRPAAGRGDLRADAGAADRDGRRLRADRQPASSTASSARSRRGVRGRLTFVIDDDR